MRTRSSMGGPVGSARTCLPPYAQTNRVGKTICWYIACCAMAPDSPARGASVAPNRRALCEIAVRVSEKVPREGRATIRPPVCSRDGRRARGKSETAAGAIISAPRGNDARRPRPPHTAARRSRDLVLVRSLAPRFRARARGTTGLADRPSRGPSGGARRRVRRRPARGADRAGRRARSSMFFHLNLDKHVLLEPRHFGKNMREVLEEKLRNEVRARNREERRPSSLLGRPPPPRGFGPRPPARRERDPPRRSIDVTLGVSTPTRPAGAPLAEGNVPEPRSESGLAQPPLTSRSRRNPLSPLSRRWRAAARVATGSSS